jgi:hypothetical protein
MDQHMSRGFSDNCLFSRYDGFAIQHERIQNLQSQIANLPAERILNTDIDALIDYYVASNHIDVPRLRLDELTAEHSERQIEVNDRYYDGGTYMVSGDNYRIEIPFDGREEVFHWSSNMSSSPPRAEVIQNMVVFNIAGREISAEQVQRTIKETTGNIAQHLDWSRSFWAGFDTKVRQTAQLGLRDREAKLLASNAQKSALANLGIKLKEKPADPNAYTPPPIKTRIVPQMPPMTPSRPADPTLDKESYARILGLVRGAGRSIEQSSSRTRSLDEEGLRDMFLVPLNAHFGTATGEAFNFTGKTDILIKERGGNLFVAECKFWGGAAQFAATIDQLLGYLTWRDTKCAIIIFNRNVGFSGVVEQLAELPKRHSQYISGPRHLDDTSNEFTFRLPNDPDRHATISVLAFDLGPKETT